MTRLKKSITLALLVHCTAAMFTARCRADEPDPNRATTAQALYDSATADIEAKAYGDARKKLEEVTKLLPEALGAKLGLAECYENLGKLASAWVQYKMVAALAPKQGQPERGQRAADKATALRPKLAMLTVNVPAQVAAIRGIAITRDGSPVTEAQWGTALPIDVGGYQISVTAPGYDRWSKQVEILADGAQVSISVNAPQPSKSSERPRPAPEEVRTWQRPLGLGVIAAGGVGLGIGAISLGLAFSKHGESNDGHCDAQDVCDRVGVDLRRGTLLFGNVATGAFIAGVTLASAGVVLAITSPSAEKPKERAKVSVRARFVTGGVVAEGQW